MSSHLACRVFSAWVQPLAILVVAAPLAAAQPTFKPIGFLPTGTFSRVGGISPNGAVVVGESDEFSPDSGNVDRAIRWEAGVMKSIGSFDFDPIAMIGLDASYDGSVVVGTEVQALGLGSTVVGWKWEAGALTQLPFLPLGDSSRADAVSYDGRIIVGSGSLNTMFNNSITWVAGVAMDSGTATGDDNDLASMYGVSADGKVAAGSSNFAMGFHAFRHEAGVYQDLGTLQNVFNSNGTDISGDGRVVVGLSDIPNAVIEAFRWEAGAMVGLGDLPGGDFDSEALATDHDGNVVVGRGHTNLGNEAFLWTEDLGIVSVKDHLEGLGLDLTGWTLTDAVAVSADGLTIAGNGINPLGFEEGWVATIVPEPSGMVMVSLLAGAALVGRWRSR